ncbi:NUMOD4 domain-containing protein [Chitinophaga sp. XS-30]|uniref:NUMOD4 domain-containing protein n=1 Tax=Chitinophaga sp. XS-30 TaxID=2604421 RepID=UPI0011DD631A|nr:NUMOD4 domain-containing protein [Chitinophaga sp. XS-30]QEH40050.1 helix-turn-helix domain-containing protein [Chitinophaga sp. XS-30]
MATIKNLRNEVWKDLQIKNKAALRKRYAVSNMGRVISYRESIEDGKLLTGSTVEGYTVLNIKPADTYQSLYLHREVAKLFSPKSGRSQKYVIHLDFDKKNNKVSNLRWASKEEMEKHQQKSPAKLAYKEKQRNRLKGLKLNVAKVKSIKRLLEKPGRKTMKQIAEQFDISEMQLYRIKSGENWGHVTLD